MAVFDGAVEKMLFLLFVADVLVPEWMLQGPSAASDAHSMGGSGWSRAMQNNAEQGGVKQTH